MPVTPDFKDRLKAISYRNAKKKHIPGKMYPVEKWVECVSQWLVVGNLKEVAAMTGVNYDLLRHWKGTAKWEEIEKEVRASQIMNLDTKLGKIVEKSLDAVLDRVENGDFIYDQKSGTIRRKPAALRDIHRVAVDTISKQDLVRKSLDNRDGVGKQSIEDHLKVLATEMSKWFEKDAKAKKIIDLVEVEDAVYEEREAGLQDGEPEVQFSPGECEEEGGEEPSSEEIGGRRDSA
jgi:hypothetical protein